MGLFGESWWVVCLDSLSASGKKHGKIGDGGPLVLKHQLSAYQSSQSSMGRSHTRLTSKDSELLGSQITSPAS